MDSIALVLLLSACINYRIDPIDEDPPLQRAVVVDEFVQRDLPAVDILFVVDNTGSMAQEQMRLGNEFESLADALDREDIAWQVGVVTTERSAADAGWLQGQPWILTPDLDDPQAAFVSTVQVGTDGSSPEAGLASAMLALELAGPDGVNAGFRRPDAVLHLVFVSDSDDQSESWYDDPAGAMLDALEAESQWSGLPARASAVVGDVPDGCTSVAGVAQPGHEYHEVATASGGVVESICSPDLGNILEAVAEQTMVWQQRFELRAEPLADSVRVSLNGERQEQGWNLERTPPAVTFCTPPPPGSEIRVEYVVQTGG